jgi:hypothetical protein
MNNQNEVSVAAVKVAAVGTAAGLSILANALLWIQIAAGLVAIVYGSAQLFFLVRDTWWRERK